MTALWLIVLCGVLAIIYAAWAARSVLEADPGNARMQEIAAAVREGAQAYLKRQYGFPRACNRSRAARLPNCASRTVRAISNSPCPTRVQYTYMEANVKP